MKKILTLILTALLFLFISCTNDIAAPDDTWEALFQKFWDQMNTEYVHFSNETDLDWDEVYEEYMPKFKELDFSSSDDSVTAFRYFKEIVWNIKDYHYNLTVYDINGNHLVCSPSMLQKWVASDKNRDIMDYPDLVLADDDGNGYITSVNKSGYKYPKELVDKYKKEAVESYYEIEELGTNFHTTNGKLDDDFKFWREGSIACFTDEDDELRDEELKLAEEWNYLLEDESISGSVSLDYFYGVTEDNIFYFYFSYFLGPHFLDDLITKDNLTPQEEKIVKDDSSIKELRDDVQKFNKPEYTHIYERFKALQGFTEMFNLIKAVADDEVLTIETDGTDEEVEIIGIVMDLRGNGGGYNYFLDSLMSSFFPDEIVFGYSRYKDGYAREEYTPWMEVYLEKTNVSGEVEKVYDKPFAVLVNGWSVSCAEFATMIVKNHLPSSCVIGQTTYGATCSLYDRTIYNSGPFSSAYFTTNTTTYQFKGADGISYETKGITPDYITELSASSDNAFIKAVDWINNTVKH